MSSKVMWEVYLDVLQNCKTHKNKFPGWEGQGDYDKLFSEKDKIWTASNTGTILAELFRKKDIKGGTNRR